MTPLSPHSRDTAARHVPVLGPEAVAWLAPRDGGTYIDATFGAGGYTRLILAAAKRRVVAIDRDRAAIAAGRALVETAGGRLTLVEDRFANRSAIAGALPPEG